MNRKQAAFNIAFVALVLTGAAFMKFADPSSPFFMPVTNTIFLLAMTGVCIFGAMLIIGKASMHHILVRILGFKRVPRFIDVAFGIAELAVGILGLIFAIIALFKII